LRRSTEKVDAMAEENGNPLTDWKGFYEELQSESPRAAVIIASAFLDAQLRELIARSLVDDEKEVDELLGTENKPDRPLSSFSARIRTAYCMGLIGESMRHDLNVIRKIRNKFAHKMHGYSFDAPEIVSWCKSIRFAKMITDAIPRFPSDHGSMFLLGVSQLAASLGMKVLAADTVARPVARDPKLGRTASVDGRA
jgi:DNA-binding MltR family transcriptional regulator